MDIKAFLAEAMPALKVAQEALPLIERYVEQIAENDIAALVQAEQKRFPNDTQAQIANQVYGDLKHLERGRLGVLGFLVDIAWADSDFETLLRNVIALVTGEIFTTNSAPVPSPATS